MNILTGVIHFLYKSCVRQFPSNFRSEFEEEMCDVFGIALEDASGHGITTWFMTLFREIRDFPKVLFLEHWQGMKDLYGSPFLRSLREVPSGGDANVFRRTGMVEIDNSGNLELYPTRLRIIAALPLLLFGLGIAATSLTRGGPWHSVPTWRLISSIVIGLLPMAVIAITGIIAFFRRLPDWGLTWIGSAFMGFLILVKTIAEELAEVGQRIISEPVEIGIVIVFFLAGVALLVITGMRGWQRGGLLSIGFSVTFTLTFFWAVTAAPFYRHDIAIWAGPFSLLLAALTYFYAQAKNSARLMILFGIGLLNIASLLTANTIWQDWFQTSGRSSSALPFVIFMLLFLICGPIAGLIIRPIQQTLHRA